MRLVGGPSPDEGRLEIAYHGIWGTVCSDGFGDEEAMVFCRMMGKQYVK